MAEPRRPLEFWRMGFTTVPVKDSASWARRFEDLGWDGYAGGESHAKVPDVYATLAVVAAGTSRMKVGSAVVVPLRPAIATASAMATVNAIAEGRARFAIGRGDSAYLLMGERPPGLKEFETYVTRVQQYLRGEEVELDNGFVGSLRGAYLLDPSLAATKPILDVACTGPKTIKMAARLADGIDFSVGADLDRLRQCISVAREARAEAGMDPDEMSLGAFVQVGVCEDAERQQTRARMAGTVMVHAHFSAYDGKSLDGVNEADRSTLTEVAGGMNTIYDTESWRQSLGGGNLYPKVNLADEFIDRFAIVGPAEECAERLYEVARLGIDRIMISTRSAGQDLEERNAITIGEQVFPLVRAALSETVAS